MKYFNQERIMSYEALRSVPVQDNGEPLVPLVPSDRLSVAQIGADMQAITGNQIFVRESVASMLSAAGQKLTESNDTYQLQIVYGYRALSIQRRLFDEQCALLAGSYPDKDTLFEAAHQYIAVPQIAGHPTGGAIDIQLVQQGTPIEFGTTIWDFTKHSKTFATSISAETRSNRLLLRSILLQSGFAPFDGEWWHFSYGDREWAAYYEQRSAIYEQTELA